MNIWKKLAVTAALPAICFMTGCTGVPDGVEVVTGFDLNRYLGTWYEIARLDHRFERGMSSVTANYSLREDGGVAVVNRGYKNATGEWEEATGKAYFIGNPDVGRLKVSFFGPFYGAYNIIALDKVDYQYAMIAGPNRDYLWILARSPTLDNDVVSDLVDKAGKWKFPADELIFVDHSATNSPD